MQDVDDAVKEGGRVMVLDAVSFLGAAVLLAGLLVAEVGRAGAKERSGRRTALADRRFLAVTGLHAVLELQFAMLEIGIPLWIALHTGAPRALIAAVGGVNCLAVVLFQVRAGRGVTDVRSAARACAWGGVLLAGVLLHSLAELLTSVGPDVRGRRRRCDRTPPLVRAPHGGGHVQQPRTHRVGPGLCLRGRLTCRCRCAAGGRGPRWRRPGSSR
ncbi:hypothetical protein [Kitasatospora terrestris]|uniref:hypothetical protein n=1 Tax=Kitasatospora terrestris TaxID=258051 RepID=UPI0031E51BCE